MMHVITGGSGSGKSAYAENLILQNAVAPLYIATMRPYGEEGQKKIQRHRKMRAGKGFVTLECYIDLEKKEIPEATGALLECMSNLTANELYDEEGNLKDAETVREKILSGIRHLQKQTQFLVIVTNEVQGDQMEYSEETKVYQKVLGEINQSLARTAEKVTEVVYGIPVEIK